MEEEKLTEEPEFKLPKFDYRNITILAMIALFVIGFGAGNTYGYRNGYSYVKDWYTEYEDRYCSCNEFDNGGLYGTPSLDGYNKSIMIYRGG